MEQVKRFEYCLSNITTSEGACSNPQITWVEKPGVFISCTGTCVTVSFADDYTDPKCIKLFIQCDTCYACEPLEKDICFCTNSDNCGPCETCNSEGYCESRCEDGQVCNEDLDICVGCTENDDCEGDKKCQAGQCKCPPATPYDLGGGRCGNCLSKNDCKAKYGECAECIGNQCVVTDCQYGVCDPVTGECAECVNSGHCEGENQCCVNKKCVCCPGYTYNVSTGKCEPSPECTGDDCGPCGVCVLGKCVPRQCPEGKVCIEGECVEQCDCNNPASCTNKGNICKNINGVCGCVSCGAGCSTGCISGCHCEGTSCVVDPCHGECEDASDCGTGCGCDEATDDCVQCSQLSCSTGTCDPVLGCECINNVCTHTGRRCIGSCNTKGDCGDGCTCHENKCVPCEFFSCATGDCGDKAGCVCDGGKCSGDPDYECEDVLEIVKTDASCDLRGELTKEECCGCPAITGLLSFVSQTQSQPDTNYAGINTVKYKWELFKGNGVDAANRLDNHIGNPKIAQNETAEAGSFKLSVVVGYSDGSTTTHQASSSVNGNGTLEFDAIAVSQKNNKPISFLDSRRVTSYDVVLTSDKWTFPNTCEYAAKEFGRKAVTTNTGFSSVRIEGLVSNSDCRDPLFTWYKSSGGAFNSGTRIRTVYVPVSSNGKYIDYLPTNLSPEGVKYVESCNHYKLEADCSCDLSDTKYIEFCNPGDITAIVKDNTCGKTVTVTVPAACHANRYKDFKLLVNDTEVWTGKLYPTSPINNKDYTPDDGSSVTSVKLQLVCDSDNTCEVEKTFTPQNTVNVTPSDKCVTVNGEAKIFYFFQKGIHTPDFLGVVFRDKNGSNIAQVSPLPSGFNNGVGFYGDSGETYSYVVTFACGTVSGTVKKNCCDSFNPDIDVNCGINQNQVTISGLNDDVKYFLDDYEIAKSTLASINVGGSVTFKPVGSTQSVTITPTTLKWLAPGCTLVGTAIPSSQCCPNTIFQVEQDGTDAAFLVTNIYPAVGDDTLYVKVNNGGFATLDPDTAVNASYGTVTVTIKRNACEQTTVTEIADPDDCDIEEDDITTGKTACKYSVDIPDDTLCRCKDGYFEPNITEVAVVDDKLRVHFSGTFHNLEQESGAGALPLISTGTLRISSIASDFSATAEYANVDLMGGYVDIPCPAGSAESVAYSFSHNVTSLGDITAILPQFTWKLCMNWPAPGGVTVSGVSVTNVTYSQTVSGTVSAANCWTVAGLKYTPSSVLTLQITWTLSNGDTIEKTLTDYIVDINDHELSGYYAPDAATCTKCTDVYIRVTELELNNGCTFPQDDLIDGNVLADVCPDGTFDEQPFQAITFGGARERKARVDFYEDTTLIKTLFTDGDAVYLDGTLPANPDGIEFGKDYSAKVSCDCSHTVDLATCFNPTVSSAFTTCISGEYYSDGSSALELTYTLSTCYAARTVYLYKADGTLIDTTITSGAGNVTARTVTLTEDMAGLENDFQVYASFDVSCDGSLYHVSRTEVNLIWTVTCAGDNSTYDLVFTGSPTLELISGSGTVNGSSIEGITNLDTVEFRGVINGCTSKTYEYDYDCTADPTPTKTPTVTKTPSKTVYTTPTVTQSKTVSKTVSKSIGGIVPGSATPTKTASKTPTLTPTVTVSNTVSKSITKTPTITQSISVTPTITVSNTVSSSIGFTQSITPTLTPTLTPTKTVSITVSITKTVSASRCTVDCTEEVTGYYCNNTTYCCGGVEVDSPSHCCNNQAIDPDNGDICCTAS